jgi:hypothetical protein
MYIINKLTKSKKQNPPTDERSESVALQGLKGHGRQGEPVAAPVIKGNETLSAWGSLSFFPSCYTRNVFVSDIYILILTYLAMKML